MNGRKGKKTPDTIREDNAKVIKDYPAGTWADLEQAREQIETLPIVFQGKCHQAHYKILGWGITNQIIEEIARTLPARASPTEYERAKQDRMIRAMVTDIDGTGMTEAHWIKLPDDIGEYLRVAFFGTTGELKSLMEARGVSNNLIMTVLSQMGLLDEDGNIIEGAPIKEAENLKK